MTFSEARTYQQQTTLLIELDAKLADGLTLDDKQDHHFKQLLSNYVEGICTDLALPTSVVLEVRQAEPGSLFQSIYAVTINNHKARFPLPVAQTETMSADELVRQLAAVIVQNRELFITSPLAQAIQNQWQVDTTTEIVRTLSPNAFYMLLTLCVRYGFSVRRVHVDIPPVIKGVQGISATTELETSLPVEELFELLCSEWKVRDVRLLLSESLYREIFPQEVELEQARTSFAREADQVRQQLLQELGCPLTPIELAIDDQLATHEYRVQLHDLRMQPCIYPAGNDQNGIRPLIETLQTELRRAASAFLSLRFVEFRAYMDLDAELVEYAFQHCRSMTFTSALRSLLDDGLPITQLSTLLEALAMINSTFSTAIIDQYILVFPHTMNVSLLKNEQQVSDAVDYHSYLRRSLSSFMVRTYTGSGDKLYIYTLASSVERRLVESNGQALTEEEQDQLIKAVSTAFEQLPVSDTVPVLATLNVNRKWVSILLRKVFPQLAVLSYYELLSFPSIEQIYIAEIALE